jgi:hypothetical protein
MTVVSLLPRALTKGMLLKKLLENVGELVDKHCGRLNWDFQQRLKEIARDFRGTWFTKIDDTTGGITQALERVRSQKQTDSQAASVRLGEVEEGLNAILQAESQFLKLKEEVEAIT